MDNNGIENEFDEEKMLYKWILVDGKYKRDEPLLEFNIKRNNITRKYMNNERILISEKILSFYHPNNCMTAWELTRDYGIDKQKTAQFLRAGKLNGFMVGLHDIYAIKWWIKKDSLLDTYIVKYKKPN